MRGKNRKTIASYLKLPQFTTMNVIDGQASLKIIYSSLIFYSLTIDNILNIIVLLILAGVSVVTLTGENGILTKVNDAKIESEKAEARERIQLEMAASVDNTGKFDIVKAKENLEKNLGLTVSSGAVTENADGKTLTIKLNGYEFQVDENGKVDKGTALGEDNKQEDDNLPETEEVGAWTKLNKVSKTGGFDSSKGVNAPKLGSELTAVTLTADINDYTTNGTWYNYEAQVENTDGKTSKWANAVTTDTDGSITGYYVWIPRYAYKITKGYHGAGLTYTDNRTTEAGTIEVKFLKGTTNEFADGTGTAETNPSNITYINGVQDQWLVHPAFLSDASIGGGFGSKSGNNDGITGIWVAKFEISAYIDINDGHTRTTRYIYDLPTDEQIKLRVLPGKQSSSIKDIGTMYRLSYIMNRKADSHMLKNSEWGAMLYLAHSKYGRNGTEITANSTYYAPQPENPGRDDVYTGGSNTEIGYLSNGIQSTTGNEYGIYDVSGGKPEYVAAYVDNGNSVTLTENGGTLYTTIDMKYKNVYPKSSSGNNTDNYNLCESKKGDAIYETSAAEVGVNSSWFDSYSEFPNFFFKRSGRSGIFCFENSEGAFEESINVSFRSCLIFD